MPPVSNFVPFYHHDFLSMSLKKLPKEQSKTAILLSMLIEPGWNPFSELYNVAAKSTEELSPKEESKEASDDNKDAEDDNKAAEETEKGDDDETEKKDEGGEGTEEGGKKKKKFKMPNIPKTIEKIRSKSQERGKNKVRHNFCSKTNHSDL